MPDSHGSSRFQGCGFAWYTRPSLSFRNKIAVMALEAFSCSCSRCRARWQDASFHIDLHSGRGKSEVEYLHGAVACAGEKCNMPTPVNKALTEILVALTTKQIPLEEFAHKPEKLLSKLS